MDFVEVCVLVFGGISNIMFWELKAAFCGMRNIFERVINLIKEYVFVYYKMALYRVVLF